jgi:hypothetical protein
LIFEKLNEKFHVKWNLIPRRANVGGLDLYNEEKLKKRKNL